MQIPLLPDELHTSTRPSATAQWTTLARALEVHRPAAERIVADEYAATFLSPAYRALLESLRVGAPLVHVAERHEAAGLATFVLVRHRYLDDWLQAALDDGAEQVLVLGAGYDSRAYRFADQLRGRPVHEVDLAPASRRKARIVAEHPELFGGTAIRRVEIDFRTQSLAARLLDSGFTVGAPTFVVWEGVSMYLTRDAVAGTLESLRELCGAGSVLGMDCWDGAGGPGPTDQVRRAATRAVRLIGEPVTFGLAPARAEALLGEHGWRLAELCPAADLTARYATGGRRAERTLYALTARL